MIQNSTCSPLIDICLCVLQLFQLLYYKLDILLTSGAEEETLHPSASHHRAIADHLTERDALAMEAASRVMEHATRKMEEASRAAALAEEPPRKRLMGEPEERIMSHPNMPGTHIKITSRSKSIECIYI